MDIRAYDDELRAFVERLLRFDTTAGNEGPAQAWLADRLDALGFETYEWTHDPDRLAAHPSFPDDPADLPSADGPNVGGVLELGSGDGRTLVLDGHVDVVPAEGSGWTGDPFEPRWDDGKLTARGAADMKAGLGACVFAARRLADEGGVDGRIVVESVVGEEEGGVGAAAAALENPYPFERDAAVIAEPTGLSPVVATEGCLMKRLRIEGRSAHAATRWHGESVLPHFERVRAAFEALERERHERVTHPLYDDPPIRWPVNVGTVRAGVHASNVPAALASEWRIGVAPGESVAAVEEAFEARLEAVRAESEWLREHPPAFERFSVQFEPAEIDPAEPVVRAVRGAMEAHGRPGEPEGATYGTDARHYIEAGIPTVVFGPGEIQQAHFPDETVRWAEVRRGAEIIADAARRYLGQ